MMKKQKASLWFIEQFQHLQESGLGVSDSLGILAKSTKDVALREVIQGAMASVKKGRSFAESVARYRAYFTDSDVAMLEVSEKTGSLIQILQDLADDKRLKLTTWEGIGRALSYPLLTLGMMVTMLVFLFIFVIPEFRHIFSEAHADLPWMTRLLFNFSDDITKAIVLMLVIMMAGFFIFKRAKIHILKIPILGPCYQEWLLFVLFRTLALSLKAGLSIQQAFRLLLNVFQRTPFEGLIQAIQYDLKQGIPLQKIFDRSFYFPPICEGMMMIAAESGGLDKQFQALSDYFRKSVQHKMERFQLWLEPVLLLITGVIVGMVVLALYQPMFRLGNMV